VRIVPFKFLRRFDIGSLIHLQSFAFICLFLLLIPGVAAAGRLSPVPLVADPNVNRHRVPAVLPAQRLLAAQIQTSTVTVNFLPAGPGEFGDTCTTWPAGGIRLRRRHLAGEAEFYRSHRDRRLLGDQSSSKRARPRRPLP
jgi:hypothetical protein